MSTIIHKSFISIAAIFIALAVNQAFSATITYRFDGQIYDAMLGGVPDGTPYFGFFSYESDSPNLGTIPNVGVYEYNYFEVHIGPDMIFSDLSSTAPGTAPRIYINTNTNNTITTSDMGITANPAGGNVGTYASVVAFSAGFYGSTAFDSTSLPGSLLALNDFYQADMSVLATISNGIAVNFRGTVDSLQTVPIPASIGLVGTGLLGLIGIARKKAS